jgi:hypothetical protein
MHTKPLIVSFLMGVFCGVVVLGQGPLTPLWQARVKADADGALNAVGQGVCDTLGPLTIASSALVKADNTGALFVCGTFANPEYEQRLAELEARVTELRGELAAR